MGSECSIFKFCAFSLNFMLTLREPGTEQLNSEHPKERSMTYCICICVCVHLLIALSVARFLATTQLMCSELMKTCAT